MDQFSTPTDRQTQQSNMPMSIDLLPFSTMQSTDTGDYFPEGYDPNEVAFSEGMGGSQATLGGNRGGPALPGMENLGADAIMMGGIEEASEIPPGMEFIMSSVPDGEVAMDVASNSKGESVFDDKRFDFVWNSITISITIATSDESL